MIVNMSGGLNGVTLTVNAPAGATVTVSKDGKRKTKVADTDGVAVFKGLSTGDWTLSITDGTQTAQKTVTITADYTTAITFFAATIHVTYPAGSTCTATDGVTTLTAPDTSGTWDCVVPNAGTWTVTCTDDADNSSSEVYINTDGQVKTIELSYNPIIFRSGKLMDGLTLNTLTGYQSAFSISGDDLVAKDEPGGKYGFYFSPKIDITQWSCLRFVITSNKSGWAYVGLSDSTGPCTDAGDGFIAINKNTRNLTRQNVDVDISKISGEHYIKLAGYSKNTTCVLKVHEIIMF